MKVAEFLVKALECEGVEVVFGHPGGTILPVYDALIGSKIRHILVRHEQAAALAADGYARATGKVGVCLATSGPGATNLVTGIANAFLDSVPMVALTGQVPTALIGTDAFQEVDIFGMTLPVVKHSFLVRRASDLPQIVAEAFRWARSGRPGPVLVDLPKDVATTEGEYHFIRSRADDPLVPERTALERAATLLGGSERPIVYAGGGIGMAKAVEPFRQFVETTRIPTVSTLKGLGALPTDHELFLGMLGMHGMKAANLAVQGCDLLMAVGARFDDRATGKLSEFAPQAKVVHLDIDPVELGKLRRPDVAIVGDLRRALRALAFPLRIDAWRAECLANKGRLAWDYDAPTSRVYAPLFIRELSETAAEDAIVTCDVGQHQMWVAQHYRVRRPEFHLSSGGLGTMGYGLPAAIGAQLGRPGAQVITVTGDGSIMMNLQELATVQRYDLPIKIVLFDNRALGMVRQLQEVLYDQRYTEIDLSDNPDFVRLAQSFDLPALRVERRQEVRAAIQWLLSTQTAALLHVLIDQKANVWPYVPPGYSNSEMLEGAPR